MSDHKPMLQVVTEGKMSYDFYPVPEGSWQEKYNRDNRQNNMCLGGAIMFAICTIIFVSDTRTLLIQL